MEKIIKKAIEGGFEKDGLDPMYFNEVNDCCRAITLDPLFWQALGKQCGWQYGRYLKRKSFVGSKKVEVESLDNVPIRFHEINLTEGWEAAVKYLSEVTK